MEQNYTKMEAEIASQKQMINFLKMENAHLKAANVNLSQNLGEISSSYDKIYKEYTKKIAELNQVISWYETSRKLLDAIRSEYEKAQALLKDIHRK